MPGKQAMFDWEFVYTKFFGGPNARRNYPLMHSLLFCLGMGLQKLRQFDINSRYIHSHIIIQNHII